MSSIADSTHRPSFSDVYHAIFIGWLILKCYEGDVELKEYECVKVGHHKDVSKTIEEWQEKGWRLHTYVCAQAGMGEIINHYLLFEKGE